MPDYDVIVLGAGGVGSAAIFEFARRGVRVLGIDQFRPPHQLGSSHGQTRVIRQAYFEHPNYVPLLLSSYDSWRDLERRTERSLLHETGLIQLGPENGYVVPGVLKSAAAHGLFVESLSGEEVNRRWPGLRVDAGSVGVFEPRAGYLYVEDCVQAHLAAAAACGAELLTDTQVSSWTARDAAVVVRTDKTEITADRLVIAAGAWAGTCLAELALPLVVRRKSLFWFATQTADYDVSAGFPVFLFELPRGIFYGFPQLDPRGVKVGEHTGGSVVGDPRQVSRSIEPEEQAALARFLRDHLPAAAGSVTDHSVCLYTMSPDEHFIIDRHPAYARVCFAAGLSGHGFKFAPVLGQALADLTLDGGSDLPIGFLAMDRFTAGR